MKFPSISIIKFAFLTLLIPLEAQESTPDFDPLGEHDDLPRVIRVQTEFIEMPHEAMTELMKKPRTSTNDSDLRAACEKLIEKKEAKVLETMSLVAVPGQSATVESVSEHIYATEYEPAEVLLPKAAKSEDANVAGIPTTVTAPNPTAFDVRKLGSTLEVEAMIDHSSKIIELRMMPTLTYLTDFEIWAEWKSDQTEVTTKMPRYYELGLKTGTTLLPGQPQMVAVQSPKDQEGNTDHTRKIMLFVRADILIVGK